MNVFDEINDWSADELIKHIDLPVANDKKSYVCPLCNNGHGGGTGDGIKPRTNAKGQTRWKCFKCGKDFSTFDLVTASLGYSEHDLAETANKLGERFGIREESETFSFSRDKSFLHFSVAERQASKSASGAFGYRSDGDSLASSDSRSFEPVPPKSYVKLYEYCRSNVARFLLENSGSYRGLTSATFEKFGLGVHPEFGLECEKKVPALIIPYDDNHFVARKLVDIEGNQKVTQHGIGAGFYEAKTISVEYPNFIFEGEIDALSAVQVLGDFEVGCIATGGATKWRKVITELENRFGSTKEKPSFIVTFDNDKPGKINGQQLMTALRANGYATEIFFFEGRMAGEYEVEKHDGTREKITVPKVDANDLLRQNEATLTRALLEAIERLDGALRAQKVAMSARVEQERLSEENQSGLKTASFAEYFAGKFFSDVTLTAKYSKRKTGFRNIDEKQIFMPGLYLLGALPATGKTSFAWQLLNQLADGGEFCIYCSYEMSMLELFTKTLTRELYKRRQSGKRILALSSAEIRRGAGFGIEDVNNLVKEFEQMKDKNLHVWELSNMNVMGLVKKLESVTKDAKKPPVVVVDYLQIIPHGKDNTKAGIDDALLRLKDYQRNTNATLLIISSFNRENYWQPASFNSFKESGGIEYGADSMWALQNHGVDASGKADKDEMIKISKSATRLIKFSCLKNRNGSAYDCFFRYYAAHDYFEAIEEKDGNERRVYEH